MSENKVIDPELVRLYEISYLVSPALAEDKVHSAVLPLKDLLAGKNAAVSAEESPKFRRLAYPIRAAIAGGKKQVFDSASFGWIRFESEADTIGEAKKLLASSPDIIRFLIVKTDAPEPAKTFSSRHIRPADPAAPAFEPQGTGGSAETKVVVSSEELDRKIDELVGV
ncbi:MAG: 30S ribosomal protein S6 [bacterium]|nr:30S ribosomal protein S6 [bacterium]